MNTTAALYLRKSKDATTKNAHLARLTRLARDHGHEGKLVVYDDWARSGGRSGLAKRTAWQDLRSAVERGPMAVYALDVGRTSRDIEETLTFERIVREHGGHFITYDDDGEVTDWTLPGNRDKLIETAHFADREWRKASRRSRSNVEMRRDRGDAVTGGHQAPYGFRWERAEGGRIVVVPNPDEPIEPLVEAYHDAGRNVLKASQLLRGRGIVGRSGKPFDPRVLGRALERAGAHPRRQYGRRRTLPSDAPLSRLVACFCGTLMTPTRDPRNKQWLSLYCSRGHKLGIEAHGRYVARSRVVLDALRREVPRRSRVSILRAARDVSGRREALEAERERIGWAVADGLLSREAARERADRIASELRDLDDADSLEWIGYGPRTPLVDWTADDAALGEQLRRVVRVVRLDEDMNVAAVELKVPASGR